MCIVALEQLFRNTFHFYRYNLLLCLLEPVIECRVWNIVANAERVDGNSIGLTLGFVEEPQSLKIFFAKHNLSSFKFSTKVCERDMLVNTPILEAYFTRFCRVSYTANIVKKRERQAQHTHFSSRKEREHSIQTKIIPYFCRSNYKKKIK